MDLFSFGYIFQILMYLIQRIADVTRQFGKSSDTTSVLKQDHLELFPWDHVQMAFDSLQGWRLHYFSGQPVPLLSHSHSKKSCSLHSRGIWFCLWSCHWASLGRAWILLPFLDVFIYIDDIPLEHSFLPS